MEFEWDRSKAERNRRKHGITFDEAMSVFGDPHELTIIDPDHSIDEDRFISVGQSGVGRLLVVGYTERGSKIRIILRGGQRGPSDSTMKKPDEQPRDEYDFRYGSRGRHHQKLADEGALVRLDPDVAVRYPTSEAVNTALRALATPRTTEDD